MSFMDFNPAANPEFINNALPKTPQYGDPVLNGDGYAQVPSLNPWGPNPYDGSAGQAAMNAMPGVQQNLQGLSDQYPAMANSYGLGDTSGATPGAPSNPSYNSQPISVTVPDTASRGFNPWSLSGEANSRGK